MRTLQRFWSVTMLLAGLLVTSTAIAQSGRISYSTLLGPESASQVKVLENAANGAVWVGFQSHAIGDCGGHSTCSELYLVDPDADRVLRRIVLPDLELRLLQVLADDRLLVYGYTPSDGSYNLQHDPSLLWSNPSPSAPHWIGLINAAGQVENAAYLMGGMELTQMDATGTDVLLVGRSFIGGCSSGSGTHCARLHVARASGTLQQVRFDTVPTPEHSNYASASLLATDGRWYIATAGALPTSSGSAFALGSPDEPGVSAYSGGLLALDATTGNLLHSTYTRTYPATQLAHDAARSAIWLLAHSTQGHLVATADAIDQTCGVNGNCNQTGPVLCFAVGYCLGEGDVALSRYNLQLSQLQYASYLGGPDSNWPRALQLTPRGDLYVAWGSAAAGNYFGVGSVNWLVWPQQGPVSRIGTLPIAPIDGPELPPNYWNSSGPLISLRGDSVFTAEPQTTYRAAHPNLFRSAGLDSECDLDTPCVELTRTQLPRGAIVQQLPASSVPLVLILLLLCAGAGVQSLNRRQ